MSDYPPAYQATPNATLREQIMDSRIQKNEREWWASRHIEQLERDLDAEREKCDKLLSVLIHADQILDDIDTCSDAHKPIYSSYSQNVFKLCIKGRGARRAAIDTARKEAK